MPVVSYQVVLYTVDGASLLPVVRGTLPGPDVLTTVDFGPTTDVAAAFALQRRWVGVPWLQQLQGVEG